MKENNKRISTGFDSIDKLLVNGIDFKKSVEFCDKVNYIVSLNRSEPKDGDHIIKIKKIKYNG